jgi:hypothetical protein
VSICKLVTSLPGAFTDTEELRQEVERDGERETDAHEIAGQLHEGGLAVG